MKLSKSLTILTLPAVLLIAGCVYLQAPRPYYVIAWLSGVGIGTLALFTWFQVCESTNKIKLNGRNKKKSG